MLTALCALGRKRNAYLSERPRQSGARCRLIGRSLGVVIHGDFGVPHRRREGVGRGCVRLVDSGLRIRTVTCRSGQKCALVIDDRHTYDVRLVERGPRKAAKNGSIPGK